MKAQLAFQVGTKVKVQMTITLSKTWVLLVLSVLV